MFKFLTTETHFFTPACKALTREQLLSEFPALQASGRAVIEVDDECLMSVMMLSTLVRRHEIDTSVYVTPQAQLDEINRIISEQNG